MTKTQQKETANVLTFTVSFNKKRKGRDGTCYTQTLRLPMELKTPLLQYLEEELKDESMGYMDRFYVEKFVEKLRKEETEEGGWYSPSLTPVRYITFFLWEEERKGTLTGKRDVSWRCNTALFFV